MLFRSLGGGGLLIGLCLWSVFVVVVGCPKPLLWAVAVAVAVVWVFFLLVVPGFFVARFVGLLNFGCFYVLFWLVFEMILLQI